MTLKSLMVRVLRDCSYTVISVTADKVSLVLPDGCGVAFLLQNDKVFIELNGHVTAKPGINIRNYGLVSKCEIYFFRELVKLKKKQEPYS